MKHRKIDGITLFTSPRCNLDCIYCFSAGRRGVTGIRFDAWRGIIGQAKDMGAKWVVFGGPGEPLLDKDTLNLIRYADSIKMRSIVFTNGTPVEETLAERLYAKNAHVIFKLHSLDPGIYDFLAGKERTVSWLDYEYACGRRRIRCKIPAGLKALLDKARLLSLKERRSFLRIESVITRYNLDCLADIAIFAKAHNLNVLFETLVFTGRPDIFRLVPGPGEYRYLYKKLKKILGLRFALSQKISYCAIRDNPVVWENGDIASCFVEKADIGNIRTSPLRELWRMRSAVTERRLRRKSIFGFRNCLGREYSK